MPILTMRFDARDDEGKSVQAPAVFARFGPIFQVVLVPHEEMKDSSPKQGYGMIEQPPPERAGTQQRRPTGSDNSLAG